MPRWLKRYGDILLVFGAVGLLRLALPVPFVIHAVIFAIYTMAFSFLIGRLGLVSFGQPVYLSIGAYGTGIYLARFGTNPYAGLFVGVVVGILFSLLIGSLLLRLTGDYFALANLALCAVGFFFFQKALVSVTNGDTGLWYLARMSSTPILNLRQPNNVFVLALILAVLVWLLMKYIDSSVYGAACLAVKGNETKLQLLGYDTFGVKWLAFVLANATAALAGALYAIYFGFVSPASMELVRAPEVIVAALLGGAGTLYGPLLGAFLYIAMQDLVSTHVLYWELFVGIMVVLIMMGDEKGITTWLKPIFRSGWQLVSRRPKITRTP